MLYEHSKEKIILVGGGGHCKVVVSIILENGNYEIIGISDLKNKLGKEILGIKINYTDDQLRKIYENGIKNAFVTIGSVGNPALRIKLFKELKEIGFNLPVIISKYAIISKDVSIGEGTVIMPGVIINPGVKIGRNCIINTGSIIEHDCMIGDHVHIAPGVALSGGITVENETHIGTGATVIQGVKIGEKSIIGAGAVVVKDIPSGVTARGIPAKW